MSRVFVTMAMSLDGFITGPEDNAQNPAGTNGMRLMDWLGIDQSGQSLRIDADGGGGGEKWRPQDPFSQVVFDDVKNTGAVISGRRTADSAGYWGGDHLNRRPAAVPIGPCA